MVKNKISIKKTTKNHVKKEFDEFADKVAKLESLKHELEALDTQGFNSEVKFIKAKMIDVNSLPEVSNDIEELKDKIVFRSFSYR